MSEVITALEQGFAPIADSRARILVLGSMPGVASLEQQQYYAHPRNAFWPIMQSLLKGKAQPDQDYAARCSMLKAHGVAVWDVLQACVRPGSLDSNIVSDSIRINDFNELFAASPGIRGVVFNGAKAEQEYVKRVLPVLADRYRALPRWRMPSTSPAMASLSFDEKYRHWRELLDYLHD